MEVFFDLQRFQDIYVGTGILHSLVSGSSNNDSIYNEGNMITIKAGAGNDTVRNEEAQLARTYLGDGDDSMRNYESNNGIIYGEAGSDTIYNDNSENLTISGGAGNDSIYSVYSKNVSISGGAGNDTIYNYNYYYSSNPGGLILTISGGKGDDIIQTSGAYYNDIIQYTQGDGNDVIYGFGGGDGGDTLKVTGKSISTMTSGDDVYVFVGDGTIVLRDAADDFSSSNFVTVKGSGSSGGSDSGGGSSGSSGTKKWRLSGTTAKYGTTSKTLATVKGAKSTSGLGTPNGKKISLASSALNKKVTVSGSYEFDFASGYKNATISGTAKADSITARGSNIKIIGGKGNDSIKMIGSGQTISGGTGADVFVYAASGGKEKITDFSSNDKLKIGASGTGNYSTVRSGDDIVVNVDEGGKITLVGAADLSSVNIVGTKQTSGQGVKVSNNGKKITLTENYNDSSFSLSGKYSSAVTLDASDALLDLSIIGNAYANKITGSSQDDTIDGGAGRDTIRGGEGNDSLFGGKGNDILIGGDGKDTLWGGAGDDKLYGNNGKDVFYYRTGEGSDTIFGYEASVDKIMLGSGSISNVTTDRDNNVIFTVGDGQIVVNNGADSTIKIVNSSGKIVNNGLYEP